jgi:hypothetical protein
VPASDEVEDQAMDLIYATIDRMLRAGKFGSVGDLLDAVEPGPDDNLMLLLALASITNTARDRIPAYARYVARLRRWLESREPNRVDYLLRGFE